jgi:hypothetical protein
MPFEKGVSGNPGGRPKEIEGLAAAIRLEFEKDIKAGGVHEAVKRGFDLLRFAPEAKDKLAALKVLLEYGYGKPKQQVELGGVGGEPLVIQVITGVPKKDADAGS